MKKPFTVSVRKPGFLAFFLVVLFSFSTANPAQAAFVVTNLSGNNSSNYLQFSTDNAALEFTPIGVNITTDEFHLQESFVGGSGNMPTTSLMTETGILPTQMEEITYHNVWNGIAITYDVPSAGILRSTYHVSVGADPSQIRLMYNTPVQLNATGDLIFSTTTGTLTASAPIAWQEINGKHFPVDVRFVLSEQSGGGEVSFQIGAYDHDHDLIIDPTFTWNTFMGGIGNDTPCVIVTDNSGNIYVTGNSDRTWGTPVTAFAGSNDAFVANFNSNGELQWNTFLGGTGNDYGYGIVLDSSGNIYITGYSERTWGSPVVGYSGNADAFAARLSNTGSLQWLTFMGSLYNDYAYGIDVDNNGFVYVTGNSGYTWGSPLVPFSGGNTDATLVKLNSATGARQWNTFLGGDHNDFGRAIILDDSGDVYLIGNSEGTWGTPVTPFNGTGNEGFAAKVNGQTGARVWNTFIGGAASSDRCQAFALDSTGNIYITGSSSTSWGSPLNAFSGVQDAFVIRLNNNGALQWSTFMGGTGTDIGRGIGVDNRGYIYVTGNSNATWGSPANPFAGNNDAFISRLSNNGIRQWNSFMGGLNSDIAYGLSIAPTGRAYITGSSLSTWGSPLTPFSGSTDGFIATIDMSGMVIQGRGMTISTGDSTPSITDDTDFSSVTVGSSDAHTFTIQNTDISNSLTLTGSPFVSISGTNASDFTVTTQPSSTVNVGGSTTFVIQFSPSAAGTRTAVLTIANSDILSPYIYTIQGNGVAVPEIEVLGNGTSIVNNDSTPAASDGTDYERVITGTTQIHTFTIQNIGHIDLGLTGSPVVTITGSNAADFSVNVQPTSPVPAGGSTIFTVAFTPSADGLRTASLTIANSDSDEDPYIYSIQGTGITAPVVVFGANTTPAQNAVLTTSIFSIAIEFNMDIKSDMGPQSGNSTANYLLFSDGGNGFQTVDCSGGIASADTPYQVDSAAYSDGSGSGPYMVTLSVNNGQPLPAGTYRLLICGTTSIENLAGVELNYGADSVLDFSITTNTSELPATGFTPGITHTLPVQPADLIYSGTGMTLEIPSLQQEMTIVGVPQTDNGWDITWLGSNTGWLQGSAFPTWNGNTVLTGHVWDAHNNPGPFVNLRNLRYGDTINIYAWGMTYIYQVRENTTITAFDVETVFTHEDEDWISLVTCEGFNRASGSYLYRRLVRAVLVSVIPGMN